MNYSNSNNEWTYSENKQFENAIAELDLNSPKLFENIKAFLPWKTIEQIKSHYEKLFEDVLMIESDGFGSLDYVAVDDGVVIDASRPINRKGVPWTEEEHRLFLIGLKKIGKGQWRDIARYYVPTKTTIQVASHAQKYFQRLKCVTPLKKRRFSINDIRLLNSEIVENSPRNPSVHIVLSEIPSHSLHPHNSLRLSLVKDHNRLINHNKNNNNSNNNINNNSNNIIVVKKLHFNNNNNNPVFSSTNYKNNNTAPTTLSWSGGDGGSDSSSEIIILDYNFAISIRFYNFAVSFNGVFVHFRSGEIYDHFIPILSTLQHIRPQ